MSSTLQHVHVLLKFLHSIFRSQTLTQNYNLYHSDQSVVEGGRQNVSFSFTKDGNIKERIDRRYKYNDYWIWAFPDLEPQIDYTIVLEDGENGYACFTKGSNSFYSDDPTTPAGYADPYLTDYLIQQSHQFALPWLLKKFSADASELEVSMYKDNRTNATYQSFTHPNLGLTMLVNSTSHLPHLIRTMENHQIFGPLTSDLILSNYTPVSLSPANVTGHYNSSRSSEISNTTILLPHRYQTLYNSQTILEDFLVDRITINPSFPADWFTPLSESISPNPRSKPAQSPEYPRSEVHEFFETGLWAGPLTEDDGTAYNSSAVTATHPVAGLEHVWSVYVGEYPEYVQLVVEFRDGVLVTDAPAHRSTVLLQWVEETLRKQVKWVVPSHHHRDHAGGVADYVRRGAKVVVPEVARGFYEQVNGGEVEVVGFTEDEPFVVRDGEVQYRAMWREEAPHARDWTYGVAMRECASSKGGDTAVVYMVDVINPGSGPGTRWDLGYARQWVDWAIEDGVPRDAVLVGSHGGSVSGNTTGPLMGVVEVMGVDYPDLKVENFTAGGPVCA